VSLYTSIKIHPEDEDFIPSTAQLSAILEYLEVERFASISVSPSKSFQPDAALREGLEMSRDPQVEQTHFLLKHESWCKRLTESIAASIDPDVSKSFDQTVYTPWDTGVMLGAWDALDYDSGAVIAKGRFYISRSGNSYPRSKELYLAAFKRVSPVKNLVAFLQATCSKEWTFTIEMS
jgi:hypothetical protein